MSLDEKELVDRAKRSDRQAFDQLVEPCRGDLLDFCRRGFRLNEDDSLDAVQDAVVRALRYITTFRGNALFSTWLYAIATNVCLDLVRRNQRIIILDETNQPGSEAFTASGATPSVEDEAIARLTSSQLGELAERVAAGLKEPNAKICRLRFQTSLTSAEIGRLVGETPSNVRTRLHRHVYPKLREEARRLLE